MNWKLVLFIVFVVIFSLPLFILQPFTNIDFAKLSLAQFGPTLAYILTIILFKDIFISIKIKMSKIIIVKTLLSIIVPLIINLIEINKSLNNIIVRIYAKVGPNCARLSFAKSIFVND